MRGRDTINTDDFEIDWSVVKRTAINERYTYSFRVLPRVIKSKSIHNLVVYFDLNRWQYSLIEFFPTQSNWGDLVAGTTKVIEGGLREVYNSVALNRSITIRIPTDYHCTHPGTCMSDGSCDLCSDCVTWAHTITINVPDDIVQIIAPSPGSGGGNTGGGGGNPFPNPFPTINDPRGFIFVPNLFAPGDLAYSRISRSQEFWNSLDYQQQEWANSNVARYIELINFLISNYNQENIELISNLIYDNIEIDTSSEPNIDPNFLLDLANSPNITNIDEYLTCFNFNEPASLTIYVDQPVNNSRKAWRVDWTNGTDPDIDVGHTFISIRQGNARRNIGFYPATAVSPNQPIKDGQYKNDSGHLYDVAISKSISPTKLSQVINYIKNLDNDYDLNDYNCTDFAMEVSKIGGLNLPPSYGNWTLGGGDNPGQLGQNIRNMALPPNVIRTLTPGVGLPNSD